MKRRSDFFDKKIYSTVFNLEIQKLGKALFESQELALGPFKKITFNGWQDWEKNPLNNRSWQWRLNWLSFLSYLMAYHRASGNDAVLDFTREGVESWLNTYLETDTDYPFEFIWHDHGTALRAEQLLLLVYYCHEHAPKWTERNAAFLNYVEKAVQIHGEWLAKDSFYSEHTNHGLEQARVLLLLGTAFEGEQALEWQQVARQRISSELAFSFTDEGVHVENSPAYHIFVFKVFLGIIRDYPAEALGDLAQQFDIFAHKSLNFITHILRPDGLLPPIGDTEQLPTSNMYRDAFGHMPEYQNLLYALTSGKQGKRPVSASAVFPRSGYAVFRDQWPDHDGYSKALHCVVKIGCSSRYHHQQDEGHISLCAGGEDWLIDSGLYNYSGKDSVRRYMRSRAAHNVPLIAGVSYDDDFAHRLGAWEVTSFDESGTKPFVDMTLDVLPPVTHQRRVELAASTHTLNVADRFTSHDAEAREITLQWHFPQDKQISIQGSRVIISSATGSQLLMELEGARPERISVVKGWKGERVLSAFSVKANQLEPSQLLRVRFSESDSLEVTTRFHLYLSPLHKLVAHSTQWQQGYSLETLSEQMDRAGLWQHSLLLGSAPIAFDLASIHREKGRGVVTVMSAEDDTDSDWYAGLNSGEMQMWGQVLSLSGSSGTQPVKVEPEIALRGIKGVSLLVVGVSDDSDEMLEALLASLLPGLQSRLAVNAQIWIASSMNASLKALCKQWAQRYAVQAFEINYQVAEK